MSKHMPPKLDLKSAGWLTRHSIAYDICQRSFDAWYDTHIRPLFENAVEIYLSTNGLVDGVDWSTDYSDKYTHKALIINIEPIKEETAEDLLRELVNAIAKRDSTDAYCEAKAFLERNKK